MPNQFSFLLYKDKDKTERLEVTVFKDQKLSDAPEEGNAESGDLIHSKAETNIMPSQDMPTFMESLKQAIE